MGDLIAFFSTMSQLTSTFCAIALAVAVWLFDKAKDDKKTSYNHNAKFFVGSAIFLAISSFYSLFVLATYDTGQGYDNAILSAFMAALGVAFAIAAAANLTNFSDYIIYILRRVRSFVHP